jgi:hypothetical protein
VLKQATRDALLVSPPEREKIEELCKILEHVNIATNVLQSDKVNFPSIICTIRNVETKLNKLKLKHLSTIRNDLIERIKCRFEYLENDDIYGLAAVLDPNYGLNWMDVDQQELWTNKLVNCLIADGWNPNLSISAEDKSSPDKVGVGWFEFSSKAKKKAMNTKIEAYVNLVESAQMDHEMKKKAKAAKTASSVEIKDPLYMDTIDPIAFWKKLSVMPDFIQMANLARKLFAIPASSGGIERVFSQCGFVVRSHRNRISDKLAEQTFFLKSNKKMMFDYNFFESKTTI